MVKKRITTYEVGLEFGVLNLSMNNVKSSRGYSTIRRWYFQSINDKKAFVNGSFVSIINIRVSGFKYAGGNLIRIAVIGCGHWGPNHIRIFSHLADSRVTMCADLSPQRLS